MQPAALSLYLAGVIFFTSFPDGFDSPKFVTTLTENPEKMRELFGLSDAGSYLGAALQLTEDGFLDSGSNWIMNLWPPGMVILDAFLLRYIHNYIPFGVALMSLTALVWYVVLLGFALALHRIWGFLFTLGFITVVVLLSPIHGYVLGYWVFYADGLGAAFFLGFLIFLTKAIVSRSWKVLVATSLLSGLCLSCAAYLRAAYHPIQYVIMVVLVTVVLRLLVLLRGNRAQLTWHALQSPLALLIVLVVMFSLTTPWLEFAQGRFRDQRVWVVTGDGFIRGSWANRSESPSFLRGVGFACELAPKRCAEIRELEKQGDLGTKFYQREMISVAVRNPIQFITDRWNFFFESWKESDAVQSLILALLFIWTQVLAVRLLIRGQLVALLWLLTPLALVLPSLIGHFEIRYLLPIKLLFLSAPFLQLSLTRLKNEARAIYNSGSR